MKIDNHDLRNPMKKDTSVVTVVRDDGKEFVINRNVLAEHINRGFTVKNNADQPTEQELKNAVGFKGSAAVEKAPTVPEEKAKGGPKPIEEWTVPELKAEATRLGLTFKASIKRDDLVALVTAKLQEVVDTEMEDHKVTQKDLDANPELVAKGVKVGEIVKSPKSD